MFSPLSIIWNGRGMLIHVGNAVNHTGLSLPVVFHLIIYSIIVIIITIIVSM